MTNAFSCYKGTGKLYLVMKIPENGTKKVFRDKQVPNKVPLLFLDVKMLRQKFERRF